MLLSLWPGLSQSWDHVAEVARLADAGDWHCVYVEDHFFDPDAPADPLWEMTAAVGALAATTTRVRLATLVASVTHRHPAVLANWATTVDHISGGRFTLGLGAGWAVDEHTAYGLELGTPGERVSRFAEALEVIDGLLHHPLVTMTGRWYSVQNAIAPPAPVQPRIPILVGAKGARMLGLTARYAQEWNAWSTPEAFRERSRALDHACERISRDPATLHRSTQALVLLTDDASRAREYVTAAGARPVLAGSPDQVAEAIASYAAQGVQEFIVPTWDLGSGAQLEDGLDALWAATTDLRAG